MTDEIKHECGFALIRLLKPLEYYKLKYGTWMYGLEKLYLLMEKQHNRGQDGAGLASLKLNPIPGKKYIERIRSNKSQPIRDVFKQVAKEYKYQKEELIADPHWARENLGIAGELLLGHLRYGTFGKNNIENVHPVMRENNWRTRNLVLAGNFNLTNVDELFKHLIELGQQPKDYSDTVTMLEKIGHFLDKEVERLFRVYKDQGVPNGDITGLVAENLDIRRILNDSCWRWDGGYAVAGLIGSGDCFVVRDPWGIRPAYYYSDDEVAVAASERPVIQTAFNVDIDAIQELKPGHAFIVRAANQVSEELIIEPYHKKSCSFERIYFSRGTDRDIYIERKSLGKLIAPKVLQSIQHDIENTVFSYIPNTAAVAFYGLMEEVNEYCNQYKKEQLKNNPALLNSPDLDALMNIQPRIEKLAVKDAKLRTFISQDDGRSDLVAHVYDVTYGIVRDNKDTLVVIDDSIVRGTTLRESILRMLDRLCPKKIIIVSSAPQIRYPDCYGIDMARLNDFVAFQAAVSLLKETGKQNVINEVYNKCKAQQCFAKEDMVNYVKEIYKPFTADQISARITEMLTPKNLKAEVEIIYNSIENLHTSCPENLGDWYFTGDYPTPGGNKVVSNAFINYIEGKNTRAY